MRDEERDWGLCSSIIPLALFRADQPFARQQADAGAEHHDDTQKDKGGDPGLTLPVFIAANRGFVDVYGQEGVGSLGEWAQNWLPNAVSNRGAVSPAMR